MNFLSVYIIDVNVSALHHPLQHAESWFSQSRVVLNSVINIYELGLRLPHFCSTNQEVVFWVVRHEYSWRVRYSFVYDLNIRSRWVENLLDDLCIKCSPHVLPEMSLIDLCNESAKRFHDWIRVRDFLFFTSNILCTQYNILFPKGNYFEPTIYYLYPTREQGTGCPLHFGTLWLCYHAVILGWNCTWMLAMCQ